MDIYGLYQATLNDSEILRDILSKDQDLILIQSNDEEATCLLRAGDILILDRVLCLLLILFDKMFVLKTFNK